MIVQPINFVEIETHNNGYKFSHTEVLEFTLSDIKERASYRPLDNGNYATFEKTIGNVKFKIKPEMHKADLIELRDTLRKYGLDYLTISTADEVKIYRISKPLSFYIMGDVLEISTRYGAEKKG